VEGFVALDNTLDIDQAWDFNADFAVAEPLPQGRPSAVVFKDVAWLFQQASMAEKADLGAIEIRSERIDVADRVQGLVRELSELGDDSDRRTTVLDSVAELRLSCLRSDGWQSSDYDWPLLSD